jgi:hypothetical protein
MRDTSAQQLPFSKEENADGARFVWFVNCRAGHPYPYTKTAEIPRSPYFTEVDSTTPGGGPRAGDAVWWPQYMAIVASGDGPVLTPEGPVPLAELVQRYGAPRFYRRLVPREP